MVGGAPVTCDWADQIGAHGYSEDAIGAVESQTAGESDLSWLVVWVSKIRDAPRSVQTPSAFPGRMEFELARLLQSPNIDKTKQNINGCYPELWLKSLTRDFPV
jgi:hypothetical protein